MKRWLTVLLIVCLSTTPYSGLAQSDFWDNLDASLARYQQHFGYVYDERRYLPPYLDYIGFAQYIGLDGGVKDEYEYTLYSSCTPAMVADYLIYLARFGYDVVADDTADGYRTLTLESSTANTLLTARFQVFYCAQDEVILFAYPLSGEATYEAWAKQREVVFTPEIFVPKTLTSDVFVQLAGVLCVQEYAIPLTDVPYCALTMQSLLDYELDWPVEQRTLSADEQVTIMHGQTGRDGGVERLHLLKVIIDNRGEPIPLTQLEFCIVAEDYIVAYPLQIGTTLTDRVGLPLLENTPPQTITGKQTLWLAFPSVSRAANDQIRLCISFTKDRQPLTQRLNFGYQVDATQYEANYPHTTYVKEPEAECQSVNWGQW